MNKFYFCLLTLFCFNAAAAEKKEDASKSRNVSVYQALQSLCFSENTGDPDNANASAAQTIFDKMKPSEKRACAERTDDYISYLIEKYS